ncbi:MAG: hypothetical protein M1818_007912 [Claussenomyces sp. TS43310]|nr:MAG: hypothetical protein M1818_007912 [Claussenomyces sp. TS43310]
MAQILQLSNFLCQYRPVTASTQQMGSRREESFMRPASKLPPIAPRNDPGDSGSDFWGNMAPSTTPVPTLRTRLPPRSRSGCWTCRQRKVKCDEERPTCRQCARLHHTCDYGSRLAFRDDTSRVKERMQAVQTAGSSVWDPLARSTSYSWDRTAHDSLPPFSDLKNDEERETKAKTKDPGTYLVVTNPESFASLPEYAEQSSPSFFLSSAMLSGNGDLSDNDSKLSRSGNSSPVDSLDDPNIIILRTFEDSSRRPSTQPASASTPSPTLTLSSQPQTVLPYRILPSRPAVVTCESPRDGNCNARLLQHYRENISPHIINADSQDGGEDLFESEARTFPPLFHAIMAISALSLSQKSEIPRTDAIVHYGRVLTTLQVEATVQSSSSDGALFTHYLLLLYEICDAGSRDDNLWQNHCNRLLQIMTQRRGLSCTEAHRYVLWTMALINTYALLSGTDDGAFLQALVLNHMVPLPQENLYSIGLAPSTTSSHEDSRHFPGIRELNIEVVLLSVQIGQVAHEIRSRCAHSPVRDHIQVVRARATEIQARCRACSAQLGQQFRQYWPGLPAIKLVDPRYRGSLYHAHALYRACIIFTHTSMYPEQMLETPYPSEVSDSISDILGIAQTIIATDQYEAHHLTFALFMAGFASLDQRQKSMAVHLMMVLESKACGGNTGIVRQVLQGIYEKQQAAMTITGYSMSIDWWEEIRRTGRGLVIFDF